MIAISNIDLYNLLRAKLGDAEAKAVTDYIDVQVSEKFVNEKQYLATKQDISLLKEELKEDIKTLEVKLEQGFKDQLKWMIVLFAPFYVGMIVFLIKHFL